MSPEIPIPLVEDQVKLASNGDLEILMTLPKGTYQVDLEHSYGQEVFNPSIDQFSDFVYGKTYIKPGKHKLLFGITYNGICPADCLDCPYGRTIMGSLYASLSNHQLTLARPISPAELQSYLGRAVQVAIKHGILEENETFAAGALLAGDPGYSRYTADLITAVSHFPDCEACRWSTIAPDTRNNVLAAFLEGAIRVREISPAHTPSFQVSLHSTNHEKRVNHTGVTRLLSMAEISTISQVIKAATGRRLSLAFVLHEGSVIDPLVLRDNFSPEHNIISLRPIYSSTTFPMNSDKLIELYSKLRAGGWDVVYMPPNQNSGDNGKPIELDNMRIEEAST